MANCEPKILIENVHFCVSQCIHCNRISLHYQNILTEFSLKDFFGFARAVTKLDFNKSCVYLENQKRYLPLSTYHQDVQMVFLKEEFEEFVDILNLSMLMVEANYLAAKKQN